MKIRIKGNSLRYRLTRSEVERFAAEGYIKEETNFGTTKLTYVLQKSFTGNLQAHFENNSITLSMPDYLVDEWANTERVGFENADGNLYLLIEKDFMCLDNVAEDQSDNYPNPLMKN
jgi:hypothetical protein